MKLQRTEHPHYIFDNTCFQNFMLAVVVLSHFGLHRSTCDKIVVVSVDGIKYALLELVWLGEQSFIFL